MEFDGVMGAHFVAAVAADAIFCVDLGRCFIDDSDDMYRAGISAATAGHTLGLDDPGEYRESVPEDRIYNSENAVRETWNCGRELKIRNSKIRWICTYQFKLI